MPIRRWLLSTTALGAVGASWAATPPSTAQAADLSAFPTKAPPPAAAEAPVAGVADFNVTWDALAGALSNQTLAASRLSVATPVAGNVGAQFDGIGGYYGGNDLGGGAAHFFWRDAYGSVGVYGADTFLNRFGGLNVAQAAFEGAGYFGRWTINGIAGVETGNNQINIFPVDGGLTFDSYKIKTRFFDEVDVSYYLTDDFKLSVGHRYLGGLNGAAAGGEWSFPIGHGVTGAIFAEGVVGQNYMHGVYGGFAAHFAPRDAPLIFRDRRETQTNWLPDALYTMKNSERRPLAPYPPGGLAGYH